jgi:hypothetical protein
VIDKQFRPSMVVRKMPRATRFQALPVDDTRPTWVRILRLAFWQTLVAFLCTRSKELFGFYSLALFILPFSAKDQRGMNERTSEIE